MDYLTILHDWGVIGLFAIFMIDKVWPQAFAWFSKERQSQQDTKLEQMRIQQANAEAAAQADREARAAERAFRHEIDLKASEANLRIAAAYEKTVEVAGRHNELTSAMLQQLNTVGANLQTLTTFLVGYTSDMRVAVSKITEQIDMNTDDLRTLGIKRAAELSRSGKTGPLDQAKTEGETK